MAMPIDNREMVVLEVENCKLAALEEEILALSALERTSCNLNELAEKITILNLLEEKIKILGSFINKLGKFGAKLCTSEEPFIVDFGPIIYLGISWVEEEKQYRCRLYIFNDDACEMETVNRIGFTATGRKNKFANGKALFAEITRVGEFIKNIKI